MASSDLNPVSQGYLASPAAVTRLKILTAKAIYIIVADDMQSWPKPQVRGMAAGKKGGNVGPEGSASERARHGRWRGNSNDNTVIAAHHLCIARMCHAHLLLVAGDRHGVGRGPDLLVELPPRAFLSALHQRGVVPHVGRHPVHVLAAAAGGFRPQQNPGAQA